MDMSSRELWTALHGMVLGAAFLLAFSGGLVGLLGLRAQWITPEGARRAAGRLIAWTWTMALLAWFTVLVGTYIVYPWYRAKPPPGTSSAALAGYPKYLLVSSPRTADWHEFGMEWKEHVAWLAPILATAVAFVVTRYREQVAADNQVRRALIMLYSLAFFAASVAGLFGALINKAAPTR
ncbi:MAG: hypothetical protein ABSH22_12800 [Tepidisphaeraceae bacterium]|jgi:hypothetical protein